MKQLFRRSRPRCGFSLLELLAVVTIIGILVAIVITRISITTDAAKAKSCVNNVAQINSALERFAVTTGSFATVIGDVDTNDYFPSGIPTCSVDGSAFTLNATTHRIEGHTH